MRLRLPTPVPPPQSQWRLARSRKEGKTPKRDVLRGGPYKSYVTSIDHRTRSAGL
jgi:hypothetical protein